MRFGEQGELIISGQTEARVASHFLAEMKVGSLDLMNPPLVAKKMGYFAFVGSRIEDFFGTSDQVEHVVTDPRVADLYAQMLSIGAMPMLPFRPARLGRRSYMIKRLPQFKDVA